VGTDSDRQSGAATQAAAALFCRVQGAGLLSIEGCGVRLLFRPLQDVQAVL
jgi:hypothetical protein